MKCPGLKVQRGHTGNRRKGKENESFSFVSIVVIVDIAKLMIGEEEIWKTIFSFDYCFGIGTKEHTQK